MIPILVCFFYICLIMILVGVSMNYKLENKFGKKVYMIVSAILGLYNMFLIGFVTIFLLTELSSNGTQT